MQPGIVASFASYIIRFQLSEAVLPGWVQLVMDGPAVRHEIERRAASSAGQYNLSLQKLGSIEIPVIAIEDQLTATRRIEAIEADLRRLGNDLDVLRRRAEQLRRAVLAAAFSGKLTGRRTDDEHIEELAQ